jgi:hypothetical protein
MQQAFGGGRLGNKWDAIAAPTMVSLEVTTLLSTQLIQLLEVYDTTT